MIFLVKNSLIYYLINYTTNYLNFYSISLIFGFYISNFKFKDKIILTFGVLIINIYLLFSCLKNHFSNYVYLIYV